MMGAWRDGPLKLVVHYQGGTPELFNLVADPGETRDIAAQHPGEVARLTAAFNAWKQALGAQEPVRGKGRKE